MADQGQMFNDKPKETPPVQTGMFTAGGRDYTPEDAQKKIENADQFIETLKTEKGELTEKYTKMEQQLQELTSRLDTSLKLEDALKSQAQEPPVVKQQEQTGPVVDEEAILDRLRKSLAQESQQEVQVTNLKTSIDKAASVYGTDWQSKLREQGTALGMDEAGIESLAKSNPLAFAKLFHLDTKVSATPSPSGGSFVGNPPTKPTAPKSVMFGSSTADLVAQWRYSGKQVGEANGFEYDPSIHQLKKQKFQRN